MMNKKRHENSIDLFLKYLFYFLSTIIGIWFIFGIIVLFSIVCLYIKNKYYDKINDINKYYNVILCNLNNYQLI